MAKDIETRTEEVEIPYSNPFDFFRSHYANGNGVSLLMESRSRNLAYGRQSLMIPNAALKITGKNDSFTLEAITEAGALIISKLTKQDFPHARKIKKTDGKLTGIVPKIELFDLEEKDKIASPNISHIIKRFLGKFRNLQDEHFGLYGAFAYDFARNFESFGDRFAYGGEPDFELYLPTTVVSFDDIREKAKVKRIFFDDKNDDLLPARNRDLHFTPSTTANYEDMSLSQYSEKVEHLIDQIRKGELMQCVLSREVGKSLKRHPLNSYAKLREINPSPYSFYYSFGRGRYLYGASPELHIKVDGRNLDIRPIAGTVAKSGTPLADFEARVKLLTDIKERREHAMLVDLARSELNRLCVPGSVKITDLFAIEEYPNLYHMVSGVTGKLAGLNDALDALLTTIPAGTLSGAPKVEAMKRIELLEESRRNFYGGAMGYLSFNGNANTGITIRSVFVRDGMSYVRAGAGVVAHSTPDGETREIQLKAEKALKVLQ